MSHSRVGGLSLEQRVWRWLKANGPARGPVVSEALGLSRQARSDALLRLKARGAATFSGKSVAVTWVALGMCPPDMRGLTPGSRKAAMWRKKPGLKINYTGDRKRVSPSDFPRIGAPALTLEQAWGFGCERRTSPCAQNDEDSETVVQYAREGAS